MGLMRRGRKLLSANQAPSPHFLSTMPGADAAQLQGARWCGGEFIHPLKRRAVRRACLQACPACLRSSPRDVWGGAKLATDILWAAPTCADSASARPCSLVRSGTCKLFSGATCLLVTFWAPKLRTVDLHLNPASSLHALWECVLSCCAYDLPCMCHRRSRCRTL